MAARTASVSGLWSDTATWGGAAVPVDTDTITINASVVVEFDVDQSGFAAGIGVSTVNGTLKITQTAGAYYLKVSGNWTFGSAASLLFNGGSIGTPLPTTVTLQIGFNGTFAFNFNATTLIDIVCAEPTNTYVKLSAAEASGQTVLSVATDLTGAGNSPYWINGAIVFIANIAQARAGEEYTISSVTSTEITLTGAMSAAKLIGAYIFLVPRNIWFRTVSGSPTKLNAPFNATIKARFESLAFTGSVGSSNIIGGICYGGTSGSYPRDSDLYLHIVNITSAAIVGANRFYGVSASNGSGAVGSSDGCLMAGIIAGCTQGLNGSSYTRVTGEIHGCGTGILASYNPILSGANLHDNTQDVNLTQTLEAYNTIFASATEYLYATGTSKFIYDYPFSVDHDQVAGAYKAWLRGGTVTSTTGTVFDGSRPRSYQISPTSATIPAFYQRRFSIPAGKTLDITCYIRKSVSMSYLPRMWVFTADKEPLMSGSPDSEDIMTNSVDTWETLTRSITNSTDAPKDYVIRIVAKNASGSVYADPFMTQAGGGAGIAKLVGKGMVA